MQHETRAQVQTRPPHAVVGIIGGIGPHATHAFLGAILANTIAEQTSDHVHLLIDCDPKHGDVNGSLLGAAPNVAPELCATARRLESAGATVLAMVCNAAHAYAPEVQNAVRIPLLNMVDIVVRQASTLLKGNGSVGILATDGCIASGVYQRALISRGLRPVTLDNADMACLVQTIGMLGRAPSSSAARASIIRLARRLMDQGADLLIAGCTEIPLALRPEDLPIVVLDPVRILAIKCIEAAGARVAPQPPGG